MTEREKAADHLKVIRSLMERATVYRTISWPTALVGGGLAVILSALLFFREEVAIEGGAGAEKLMSEGAWVICWMLALLVVAAFNSFLISRKSKREGKGFFSPGLKMALRAIAPPMVAGGVIGTGLTLASSTGAAGGAAVWVICYGLALLATRGLAPVSIPRLGWAFLLAGLAAFAFVWGTGTSGKFESPMLEANLIMGLCFGVFHLIYGFLIMRKSKQEADEPGM